MSGRIINSHLRYLISFVAFGLVLSVQAVIRYCAPEPLGNDANDGLTPLTPKTFMGIAGALSIDDELRCLPGTYYPTAGNFGGHAFSFSGPVVLRGWNAEQNAPADPEDVIFDLDAKYGLFYSVRGLQVYNLTIRNAHARTYSGGAICLASKSEYYDELAIVSNCIFKANYAYVHAGGAVAASRPATVVGCLFEGNTNDTDAGALYLTQSSQAIGCVFVGNVSKGKGGAVFSSGSQIVGCVFSNNVAISHGGAIYGSADLVRSCTIVSNRTENCGGAYAWNGVNVTVLDDCLISNNVQTANGNWACGGGALFLDNTDYGKLLMTNCTVACNSSAVSGGGIMMRYGSDLDLRDVRFFGNFANATLSNGTLAQNSAGAAIWFINAKNGTNTFVNCTFDGNRYRSDFTVAGGSINSDASVAYLSGCTFKNGTGNFSAAEYAISAAIDMSCCHFLCNTNTGSGVLFSGKSGVVSNCTARKNYSTSGRAGITLSGGNGTTNIYTGCTFENNYSGGGAAGIIVAPAGMFKVEDCVFRTNAWAGGFSTYAAGNVACLQLVNATDYAGLAIDRCIFEGNTNAVAGGTGNNGGAIGFIASKNATAANILVEGTYVRNSLFVNNFGPTHANRRASAIYLSANSTEITIENCTFVAHPDKPPIQYETNPLVPKIGNCAFADNAYNITAELMTHSWQGALADAKLVAPETGDYCPTRNSPLVNTGAFSGWMSGATDLVGKPRVYKDAVDIGCYEYVPENFGFFISLK
ncbi:MAG TPA: hypothetical protein PLJ32_05860 [Kiritimatiellia bacterium]|jgi:predicted outer membrane repeat protein|nr:hypothetical protein [Kiritimatiellia bacterium]